MQPYPSDTTQPYAVPRSAPNGQRMPGRYAPMPPVPVHYPSSYPPPPPRPVAKGHAPRPPQASRMPKAEALALTRRLKRGTVGVTLAAFLALAGLAAAHITDVTAASQSTSPTNVPSSSNDGSQPATQQNNPFFGNPPSGGTFGPSGGSQTPVTGTGTS